MKVKIFDCEDEKELEDKINSFIEEIEKKDMEVKDIKYSTSTCTGVYNEGLQIHSEGMFVYSALVMYGPDGKLYLNLGNSLSEAEYNDEFGVTA